MTASAVQVELDTSQAPFDLLPEPVRATLRAAVDLHYLRKGERLLEAGQPSTRVYVILKGHVQAFEARADGEQQFADYGPGDVLGAFAVIMGKARYSYRALEDTLCHVIPAERFQQLVNEYPRFAAWFHAGLSAKRKLLAESEAPAEMGRLMLTRAGEAQLAPALFVDGASSLAECVRMMRTRHVTCLLVGDPADPAIVTRTDILYALALSGSSAWIGRSTCPPGSPVAGTITAATLCGECSSICSTVSEKRQSEPKKARRRVTMLDSW